MKILNCTKVEVDQGFGTSDGEAIDLLHEWPGVDRLG